MLHVHVVHASVAAASFTTHCAHKYPEMMLNMTRSSWEGLAGDLVKRGWPVQNTGCTAPLKHPPSNTGTLAAMHVV